MFKKLSLQRHVRTDFIPLFGRPAHSVVALSDVQQVLGIAILWIWFRVKIMRDGKTERHSQYRIQNTRKSRPACELVLRKDLLPWNGEASNHMSHYPELSRDFASCRWSNESLSCTDRWWSHCFSYEPFPWSPHFTPVQVWLPLVWTESVVSREDLPETKSSFDWFHTESDRKFDDHVTTFFHLSLTSPSRSVPFIVQTSILRVVLTNSAVLELTLNPTTISSIYHSRAKWWFIFFSCYCRI
jgi:hypothetical protein